MFKYSQTLKVWLNLFWLPDRLFNKSRCFHNYSRMMIFYDLNWQSCLHNFAISRYLVLLSKNQFINQNSVFLTSEFIDWDSWTSTFTSESNQADAVSYFQKCPPFVWKTWTFTMEYLLKIISFVIFLQR